MYLVFFDLTDGHIFIHLIQTFTDIITHLTVVSAALFIVDTVSNHVDFMLLAEFEGTQTILSFRQGIPS